MKLLIVMMYLLGELFILLGKIGLVCIISLMFKIRIESWFLMLGLGRFLGFMFRFLIRSIRRLWRWKDHLVYLKVNGVSKLNPRKISTKNQR